MLAAPYSHEIAYNAGSVSATDTTRTSNKVFNNCGLVGILTLNEKGFDPDIIESAITISLRYRLKEAAI